MRKAFVESKDTPVSLKDLVESISVHVGKNTKFIRFKRLYKGDRVAFVHDCMNAFSKTIAPYQEEILGYYDEGRTRVAIRGPHGLGKTTLASVLTHHTVLTSEDDAKIPTTASAWRQLERYLWPEIHKVAKWLDWHEIGREPYSKDELLVRSIRTRNAESFAIASDDHTTLEGAHARTIAFIFDEAKTIPVPTWDAMEGAFSTEGLTDHVVIVFAISTPGEPSGRFYDIHMQGQGYNDWHVRHVKIEEAIAAKRVSFQWVEQRRLQWGEDSTVFKNRVLGEFADNTEDGVIALSWVNAAIDRWREWDDAGRPALSGVETMGVDVARKGEDSTVLALRIGFTITELHQYRKNPTTVTAGHVKRFLSTRSCIIEGDPLGSAVYDMLREQGFRNIRLLVPGGKSTFRGMTGQETFLNNRAAMWWNLRELLDPSNGHEVMLPPEPRLIGDLTAPTWEPNSRGVIQLEGKGKIKARIGRSTDFGDAVCLAFWNASRGGGVVF